jgi:hypothetical protein
MGHAATGFRPPHPVLLLLTDREWRSGFDGRILKSR